MSRYFNVWEGKGSVNIFRCGEGPRSRSYGLTEALRLIVQPCNEDEEKDDQFSFFQVMEHGGMN